MQLFIKLIALSICISCANRKSDIANNIAVINTYTKYCASCHGNNVAEFRNIKWKYGISKEEIIYSITNGYDKFGMPAFKEGLTKTQIAQLAAYMINALDDDDNFMNTTKKDFNIYTYDSISVKLDTLATDLNIPWGVVQLPTRELLVTDKNGTLYKIDTNKNKTTIKGIPEVVDEGQGGLLDIALHPQYNSNRWIYISYSKAHPTDGDLATTAIVRGKIENNTFTSIENIFIAQPYTSTRHHYGSRITFDNDNYIYFSVGERGKHFEYPQQLNNDNGKIHRLIDDGTIPADNPFFGNDTARKSIYSYGHRNPQGLFYNTTTNQLWENEHGPKGGDEINVVQKGLNYGWPVISYGINYDGSILTTLKEKPAMQQPNWYWVPSIAPSGFCVVNSDIYKTWRGTVLTGSLKYNYISKCIIEGTTILKEEKILEGIGRVRDVKMGSDGYIYITKENPGMVLKVVPLSN